MENFQIHCRTKSLKIPSLVCGWNGDMEAAWKQLWKLSLRPFHPSYSMCLSAPGKVCEWVAALPSSSVCSGVSRSQEVIEFPLLKISISTPAGNPPEMKWTADVYVCVVVGVWREKAEWATQSEEGDN